ncbi:unnamed protein product [Arabis nemorensis]|uniref:Histone deacetylase n=1 Tax=Arabis nemorensis TaxID=586526 RepID=A0A565BTW7_9BRAS|nr:unnamed protein product [Arabis nemorensis]
MESSASLASGPDGRKRRVSYFYDGEIRDERYGLGHLWEPERINMVHNLIDEYGLRRHLEFTRLKLADVSDFVKFHSPGYVDFLASITPEYVDSLFAAETVTDPSLTRFNLDGDLECPVFHGLFGYCRGYAGGTISAAVKLNNHDADIAINWAGGMHRAKRDKACGYGYVNDVVLGILELLKVFKRVLCVDIGFRHGDAVQEAFYDTDRVMTLSFHTIEDSLHPKTGDITDVGVGKGEYCSLNVPLEEGLNDTNFTNLFTPVIHRAMEIYQPEAVVLQCGADSLAGDLSGGFNLTVNGHARCLRYIRSFNVPLMVLGGEGSTLSNVARCWCYETAVAVGVELDDDIPPNKYIDYHHPDYTLHASPNPMDDLNSERDIKEITKKLLKQLSQVMHAPSVQFQDTSSISQVAEAEELDMEMRPNPRVLSGSASYESDSDDDWDFLG